MEQEIRSFIEHLDLNIPVEQIPADRQYWFLRTEGGLYYKDFFLNNFIAIGYNEIENPRELLNTDRKKAFEFIKETYPKITKPGKVLNQIERFYSQMKKDDVVMIPGIASNTIAFGIIGSDVFLKNTESDSCPFIKRRRVQWVKEVSRRKLDPRLYPMTRPHNTISNANQYGDFIDRTIHDFYIKGNKSHFIIDVKTENNVSLQEFRDLIDGIYLAIDIVNELNVTEKKYSYEDIKLKISVQSQGVIELLTEHWRLLLLAGGVIGIVFGVDFSILGQRLKTEGVKGYFDKVLQLRHERKLKEMEHKYELEKMDREHNYLKERLQLEFPNEKSPAEDASGDHKGTIPE